MELVAGCGALVRHVYPERDWLCIWGFSLLDFGLGDHGKSMANFEKFYWKYKNIVVGEFDTFSF